MKVSKAVKQQLYRYRIEALERQIAEGLITFGFDPDNFRDEDAVIDKLGPMLEIGEYMPQIRFQGSFQIWKSYPKSNNQWMEVTCLQTSTHRPVPVDEEYDAQFRLKSTLQRHGFIGLVHGGSVLAEVPGKFFITACEMTPDDGDALREVHMVHPYATAPTFHELLRIILEWHWAYKHLNSREPMAILCNDFCEYYDLDVDDATDTVVKDLLAMPDGQVAQFIKTGTAQLNIEPTKCPTSIKLWAARKGFVKGNLNGVTRLYEDCLSLKWTKEQLELLLGV